MSDETRQWVDEAIEEAWHDLGNGIKTKAKVEDKMKDKLDDLVVDAKKGDWRKNFENTVIEMLMYDDSRSNESLIWYGHLVIQCEIKRDLSLPSPAGVRFKFNKYELFINPLLFGLYDMKERIAILKHEMLHIINLHILRQKDRDHKKWNYGTDTAINQLIKNIPKDGLQPETFELERNMSAEQYYDLIPTKYTDDGDGDGQNSDGSGQGQSGDGQSGSGNGNADDEQKDGSGGSDVVDSEDKLKDMIRSALSQAQNGMVGDHSKWNDSEGDEASAKEIARQMTDTAAEKSKGNIPMEAMDAINLLKMKEQVNWKKELRKIVGNKKAFSKLTIKKRDRRLPHRNDLRGKKRDHIADVLVVIDVSGSMSNDEIIYGLNEIRGIAEKSGAGVQVIQVDTEPYLVSDFDPKANKFNRLAAGGTYLYPAIQMAIEEKLRFDACVMITDGFIENSWDEKIPKVPFFWLVTENKSNLSLDVESYPRMKSFTLKIDKK